jgi:hypothetical protein
VGYVTLAREESLRVPLALAYGALSGAWVAALRHAYTRVGESRAALDTGTRGRLGALRHGLAALGLLALLAALGVQAPPAIEAAALAPLAWVELRAWLRSRALA